MKFLFFRFSLYSLFAGLLFSACAGSPPPSETVEAAVQEDVPVEEPAEPAGSETAGQSEDRETVSESTALQKTDQIPAEELPGKPAEAEQNTEVPRTDEVLPESIVPVKPPGSSILRKNRAGRREPEKPEIRIVPEEPEPESETVKPADPEQPAEKAEVPVSLYDAEDAEEIDAEDVPEAPAEEPVPPNPLLTSDNPYVEAGAEVSGSTADDSPEAEEPAIIQIPVSPLPDEGGHNSGEEEKYTADSEPFDDPEISAAAPSRLLESPGEFSITMDGQGWIFRSDRSTPGSWRFLERKLDGEATVFRFRFTEKGNWNLVFERQDLSSGGSETEVRKVVVQDDTGTARIDNGPLPENFSNSVSGEIPSDAEQRNQAAVDAVERGNPEEALKYWEVDASGDDEAGRKARAALVENAVQSNSINPLLTWLPRYLEDSPESSVLAGALNIFEDQAGYEEESLMILEKLVGMASDENRPEWLYRLAFHLEKPGEYRDLDRAASLYQEVIRGWPLSRWRDQSEERLQWLNRHYFRVR